MRSSLIKAGAVGMSAALVLTGCLSSDSKTTGDYGANSNKGKTINFTVGFSGDQFTNFKSEVDSYAKTQGITINWASDSNFNADIVNKVKAGNLPDIAMFPQPGIMLQLAKEGKLAKLNKILDVNSLKSQMVSGITDPGTMDGVTYGIAPSINVKSLVFYPKKAWATAGYKIPTTLDELMSLTNQIRNSGKTPWCIGIESGPATGWPATDWIENLVLNFGGTQTYNDWVSHKIKFDSPIVKQAGEYFEKIFATNGNVYGGRSKIVGNAFGTAGNPMFNANLTESNPGCYLFKQGNFIVAKGFFPDKILANTDANIGAFFFPGKTASDHPVEGGGDLAALFSGKNENAIKIMKFMLNKDFGKTIAPKGGYISPFKNFNSALYPDDLTRQMANIAYQATSFSFDGSDAMPGQVGSGSFWKQMVAWVQGTTSLDSALQAIDASWPKTS